MLQDRGCDGLRHTFVALTYNLHRHSPNLFPPPPSGETLTLLTHKLESPPLGAAAFPSSLTVCIQVTIAKGSPHLKHALYVHTVLND